jgi:hypothetical protein
VKLNIHLHLVSKSRMVDLHLHSPYVFIAWCLVDSAQSNFSLLLLSSQTNVTSKQNKMPFVLAFPVASNVSNNICKSNNKTVQTRALISEMNTRLKNYCLH